MTDQVTLDLLFHLTANLYKFIRDTEQNYQTDQLKRRRKPTEIKHPLSSNSDFESNQEI